jgi:transposase InsO family protein
MVKSYGLQQEFITPNSPEQNGMVELAIRTLKEQRAHRHRFESLQHASRVSGDWIGFYNHQRPHQALGMKTPAEAYGLQPHLCSFRWVNTKLRYEKCLEVWGNAICHLLSLA